MVTTIDEFLEAIAGMYGLLFQIGFLIFGGFIHFRA
jgi:hypothetical protein